MTQGLGRKGQGPSNKSVPILSTLIVTIWWFHVRFCLFYFFVLNLSRHDYLLPGAILDGQDPTAPNEFLCRKKKCQHASPFLRYGHIVLPNPCGFCLCLSFSVVRFFVLRFSATEWLHLQTMMGWLTDFLRLAFAPVYYNRWRPTYGQAVIRQKYILNSRNLLVPENRTKNNIIL